MSCGTPSTRTPPPTDPGRRARRIGLALFRLSVVAAAIALVHFAHQRQPAADPAPLLEAARAAMPATASLGDPAEGMHPLLDDRGEGIGWVARSFPLARPIHGYAGPSEVAIVFDSARRVVAVQLLQSADTAGHVRKVRQDAEFWNQWNGRSEARLGDLGTPRIVSGATLTSDAIARGLAARFGARGLDQWFPDPLTLAHVQAWFPTADALVGDETTGRHRVLAGDELLGLVLRSSRMGVSARGFNGVSDVLLALDPAARKVIGVGLLASRDNEPYVGDVKDELRFADGFAGRSVEEVAALDPQQALFVSGASYTASAVGESVREILRREQAAAETGGFPWKLGLGFLWIGTGIAMAFSKRLQGPRLRLGFAAVSVASGLTLGWILGQDQLIGWSRHGTGLAVAAPWLVLAAVAMVLPAITGKNVYCSRICPHGAAQILARQVVRRRFALPPKLHRALTGLPWLTLLVIWAVALLAIDAPFSHAEPFEIWSSGFYALLPAALFTVGIAAAFFLPQAYCHYGCPTGALLKFLTHAPGRWTRRDSLAAALVAAAAALVFLR
jgi:NosR/NirI family transcriptional regulator, nitrous oxide reductase regulator